MPGWHDKIQAADRTSTIVGMVWGVISWAYPSVTVAVVVSVALVQFEAIWNFLGWSGLAVTCFALWIVSVNTIKLTKTHLPKGVKLEPSTWIMIAGAVLIIGIGLLTWSLRAILLAHKEENDAAKTKFESLETKINTIQEVLFLGATRERLENCLTKMKQASPTLRFSAGLKAAFKLDDQRRASSPPGTFIKPEWLNIENRLRQPMFAQFRSTYGSCFKGKDFASQPKTLQPGEPIEGADELSEASRSQFQTTFLSWRADEEAVDRAIHEAEKALSDIDAKIREKNRPSWMMVQ